MRRWKKQNANIRSAERIGRLLAAAGLMLVAGAAVARAQARDTGRLDSGLDERR